jgi:hypothetical protein
MRPRLRPNKGWRYRLILCDSDGDYVVDDFNKEAIIRDLAMMLLRDLEKIKEKKYLKVNE